jgi:hypothetical protein
MSTWAAVAARDAALTSSTGTGLLHGVTPGAIDGFAIGALLTGVCFLVLVAPRMLRRSQLRARHGMWAAGMRHARVRGDYFASPGDGADFAAAISGFGLTDLNACSDGYNPLPAPEVFAAAPVSESLGSEPLVSEALVSEALAPIPAPAFADSPGLAVFTPAAAPFSPAPVSADGSAQQLGEAYPRDADSDPYALDASRETLAAESAQWDDADSFPPPATGGPGPDLGEADGGRGYRSRHRVDSRDGSDRRHDSRRGQPRHAAPSAGLASRVSGRFSGPPVAARG